MEDKMRFPKWFEQNFQDPFKAPVRIVGLEKHGISSNVILKDIFEAKEILFERGFIKDDSLDAISKEFAVLGDRILEGRKIIRLETWTIYDRLSR